MAAQRDAPSKTAMREYETMTNVGSDVQDDFPVEGYKL